MRKLFLLHLVLLNCHERRTPLFSIHFVVLRDLGRLVFWLNASQQNGIFFENFTLTDPKCYLLLFSKFPCQIVDPFSTFVPLRDFAAAHEFLVIAPDCSFVCRGTGIAVETCNEIFNLIKSTLSLSSLCSCLKWQLLDAKTGGLLLATPINSPSFCHI